jgi:hypothetical protein
MARGVVQVPVENGKKELGWYVGQTVVNGTVNPNPIVSLRVERDADFLIKKLFLVQWPSAPGGAQDPNLRLPPQASVTLRDGGTRRPLSLLSGIAQAMVLDATPRDTAMHLGLPCPFLVRAANNLYAEITNPSGVAWTGDLYLVAEGFKVLPQLAEEIPAKIKSYAVPYSLNVNALLSSPAAASGNITGQFMSLTNDGAGKFLVKGMVILIRDANNNDKTSVILPALGLQIIDSTAGNKQWVNNGIAQAGAIHCPASLLTYGGSWVPFCQPRYIDPMGTLKIQAVFSDIPAVVAAVNAAATWPLTMTISLYGSLLPV